MTASSMHGFARSDGRTGCRNHLLILPSVICSSVVCERVADEIYGAVTLPHQHGCSQVGEDSLQTFRVLRGCAENPNVGAVVIVSLGCEVIDAHRMAHEIQQAGKPVEHIRIQDVGGSIKAIQRGVEKARNLSASLEQEPRTNAQMRDLCLGLKWGDGARNSGSVMYAQRLVEEILNKGGTVILGETEKALQAISNGFISISTEHHERLRRFATGKQSEPLISVPEDASLHYTECTSEFLYPDLSKHSVQGVLAYGECPGAPGLYVAEGPVSDVESLTGYAASGCNIVVFFSQEGSSVGSPIVPVIKITPPIVRDSWNEHIDMELQPEFEGQQFQKLLEDIMAVFSGQLTKAEILGHDEFAIHRIGLSL